MKKNCFMPVLVMTVTKTMRNYINSNLKCTDISNAHIMYLVALSRSDKATMANLSRMLNLDKSNTTRIISELEKYGYVQKENLENMSKNALYFLTEKGQQTAKQAQKILDDFHSEAIAGVSKEEAMIVDRVLNKIYDNIMELKEKYK